MKKLIVLATIAAAAWGAMKLLRTKDDEIEFGSPESFAPAAEV
jgi:hypothetical protein